MNINARSTTRTYIRRVNTYHIKIILFSSQEVIALDKPILVFNLSPTPTPDTSGIYGKSECVILVRNLTNSHVAIRTKTTKKDVYAVNPTYGIVNPAQTFEIKFVYYIKVFIIIKDLSSFILIIPGFTRKSQETQIQI